MRQVLDCVGSPCFVQLIQLKFQLLFANCIWWRYLKYLTFLVALLAADPWKSQVTLKDVGFCKGDCGSDTCVLASWGYPYIDWLEILLFCSANYTFVFCLWSYPFQNVLVMEISKLYQVAAARTVLAVCVFFSSHAQFFYCPTALCSQYTFNGLCNQYQWVPCFLSLFVSQEFSSYWILLRLTLLLTCYIR